MMNTSQERYCFYFLLALESLKDKYTPASTIWGQVAYK